MIFLAVSWKENRCPRRRCCRPMSSHKAAVPSSCVARLVKRVFLARDTSKSVMFVHNLILHEDFFEKRLAKKFYFLHRTGAARGNKQTFCSNEQEHPGLLRKNETIAAEQHQKVRQLLNKCNFKKTRQLLNNFNFGVQRLKSVYKRSV